MKAIFEPVLTFSMNGYLSGLIIAVLILFYLVYTLIKPEKF